MSPTLTESEAWFATSCGAATHPGRVRSHNEDAHLAAAPVFVVADGMGGHSRGEVASAAVVDEFGRLVGSPWVSAEELHGAIVRATAIIDDLSATGAPPGSTASGVVLAQQAGRPYWLAFNVGDSRVYLHRDGRLRQVSVDHSFRQELLDRGTPEAEITVGRNVITRALGAGQGGVPVVDQWLIPAAVADRVLICSDGLSNELDEATMEHLLGASLDPQDAAAQLVTRAVDAGGRDNVTAVVVDAVVVEPASWATRPDDATTLGSDPAGDDLAGDEDADTSPDQSQERA